MTMKTTTATVKRELQHQKGRRSVVTLTWHLVKGRLNDF